MNRLQRLTLLAALTALPLAQSVSAQEAEGQSPAPDATLSEDAAPADLSAEEAAPAFEIRDGYDVDIAEYQWTHRPVVVFADSPADPRYQEQIDELLQDIPALMTRDVVVFVDTDPKARSALRKKLRPRGFMLVLIGKDGGVKLRKPLPWSVRELSRTIDKMPMRQREIEARREG
ncbi:DUF4174 domain-containing protein [Tritonibacter mobilis]|uniref:DUF4174 domain-containing protein n=1 Tax=Tritonibacter mobilis TaxID=379347 RepID=UPI003A5C12C2